MEDDPPSNPPSGDSDDEHQAEEEQKPVHTNNNSKKRKLAEIIHIDDESTEEDEDITAKRQKLNNQQLVNHGNHHQQLSHLYESDSDESECSSSNAPQSKTEFYAEKEVDFIMQIMEEWAATNYKHESVKWLQGFVVDAAFKDGDLCSEIYRDAAECIRKWSKYDNIDVFIYSHGTVAASQMLLQYSTHGNLDGCISRYFDKQIPGKKRYITSYRKLLNEIQSCQYAKGRYHAQIVNARDTQSILFISDDAIELRAAQNAGLSVVQCVRDDEDEGDEDEMDASKDDSGFVEVSSFHEIQWEYASNPLLMRQHYSYLNGNGGVQMNAK